jgi:hypothetical protein
MRSHERDRNWFSGVGPGLFWGLDARWFERPDRFNEAPSSPRYRPEPSAPVKRSRWAMFTAWLRRVQRAQ